MSDMYLNVVLYNIYTHTYSIIYVYMCIYVSNNVIPIIKCKNAGIIQIASE